MIRKTDSKNQKADISPKVYKVNSLSGFKSCYAVVKPSYERECSNNEIFSLKWIYYGPKGDILDNWGTLIFCLLSYHILSKNKSL